MHPTLGSILQGSSELKGTICPESRLEEGGSKSGLKQP